MRAQAIQRRRRLADQQSPPASRFDGVRRGAQQKKLRLAAIFCCLF
jgi:hypothetical protein